MDINVFWRMIKLVVDKEAADVVKWIFESYVEGTSLGAIIDNLFQKKVYRPSDYRKY